MLLHSFVCEEDNVCVKPGHMCCDVCRETCSCLACTDLDPLVNSIYQPSHELSTDSLYSIGSDGESDILLGKIS